MQHQVQQAATGKAGTLAGPAGGASGPRWQRLLAEAFRDVDALWDFLQLPPADLDAARRAAQGFPLLVPRGFAALMRRGDPADPLLRQVLPLGAELRDPPGFTADPLHESGCAAVPGLLTKYRGRALLVATGACAVHCRYCFRRHFPYAELPRGARWWAPAMAAIAGDGECHELILSGGDPLTLPDAQLAELVADAAAIPHLARLRIHTRLPVVLPERVDDGLLAALRGRLSITVVIHANHPAELSPAVAEACRRWRSAGALLLNQSVLLAGVNDDAATLAALSERLAELGVAPYYLHQLDRVSGAAHFAVDDARAQRIHADLHARLSGWLVPRLVREIPGDPGKTPLAAAAPALGSAP
jgi:L-lysine 2,3-aminomutase